MRHISWSQASAAGLLYAMVMCAWVYYDRGLGFDELAIRFAIYFAAFTVGFRLLLNLLGRREPDDN
ncbi:MAG: hypothetical protein WA957_14805 [Alteraurantiacibacter sp.]